ncbi:AAA family ATPase [Okeania sp. SIO2B3]|uniref:AAA family ATPase n=1 Tax=Okeania sp. SIO2B3 TaxID=2607784 RepID=UPI0013C1951A|nr:AAA family ATPase [Okeania sp. SIO2B3]NET46996.1 AAA family ATPase [Okeania sp. SIO2B3]
MYKSQGMLKSKEKNPNYGGYRPGSGRKKKAPTKAIRVREDVAIELEILIKAEGADYVLDLLRKHTEPHFLRAAEEVLAKFNGDTPGKADRVNIPEDTSPIIKLNSDQEAAIKFLNQWFASNDKTAILSGAGGTGKTFTIGYWLQQLPNVNLQWPQWVQKSWNEWKTNQIDVFDGEAIAFDYWLQMRSWDYDGHSDWESWILDWMGETDESNEIETIFLAPTHKAKNVLKRSLSNSGINSPEVYTVAQALGKQPIIIESGFEEFQMQDDIDLITAAELVIVDEASMVGKDDYQEIINRGEKILFLGDKDQLPPVGEHGAMAFINPPSCELKKAMRYSGHILNECNKLREGVQQNFIHPIKPDGDTIVRLKRVEALQKAIELMKSDFFQQDSTFARILAFRNKQVDSNNKYLKPKIYDRKDDYFEGLRLIANKPVQRKSGNGKWQIYCNNSEEIKVLSDPEVVEINDKLLAAMPNNCQELKGLYGVGKATIFKCLSDGGIEFNSIILDDKANLRKQELIRLIQAKYKQTFAKNYKGALAFLYRWGDDLKDIFSSTVHKSQGSTYNHVFVELSDILRPPSQRKKSDPDDRPKLLYTAVSRASERVYLIES